VPTDVATIELARQLVTKLEVNPASLHADIAIPTVADYLPIVYAAASPHMLRSYGTYWQRAAKYFARQRLTKSSHPTLVPSTDK